jgi:general transcription factor 3C polypeptide 2
VRPCIHQQPPLGAGATPPPPPPPPAAKRERRNLLTSLLSISAAPYSSYIPEPKTLLHHASAEAKQLWVVAALALMARTSTPMRLLVCSFVAAATIASLPPRLWRPQLLRVGALSALIFVFAAAGADGVAPLLSDRAAPAAAAAAAAGGLPASMAPLAPSTYRYVVLNLGGFVTVTKRSLVLAVALSGLTFTALQAASLCLVTTPPERMAVAVGRALRPLGALGVPVAELVLTVLLALRFMATVFEEGRNLCLGLASRGVDWSLLGARGAVGVALGAGGRLFSNLLARCESIAVAMVARGFAGPEAHALHVGAGAPARGAAGGWADAAVLLSMAALVALSRVLV